MCGLKHDLVRKCIRPNSVLPVASSVDRAKSTESRTARKLQILNSYKEFSYRFALNHVSKCQCHSFTTCSIKNKTKIMQSSLQELIRGIRNHKSNEHAFIVKSLQSIRQELRGTDLELKTRAVIKLTHVKFPAYPKMKI